MINIPALELLVLEVVIVHGRQPHSIRPCHVHWNFHHPRGSSVPLSLVFVALVVSPLRFVGHGRQRLRPSPPVTNKTTSHSSFSIRERWGDLEIAAPLAQPTRLHQVHKALNPSRLHLVTLSSHILR